MAEEEQEQVDENKRIRPQERARGQKRKLLHLEKGEILDSSRTSTRQKQMYKTVITRSRSKNYLVIFFSL